MRLELLSANREGLPGKLLSSSRVLAPSEQVARQRCVSRFWAPSRVSIRLLWPLRLAIDYGSVKIPNHDEAAAVSADDRAARRS